MAWYPQAKRRELSRNYTRTKTAKNCVVLHTSASATATSLYGWFSNPSAQSSSHFHVANDGTVEQYIDTDYISWANREGNSRSVTIETQGSGYEAWTEAQLTAMVKLCAWITQVHGIPVRMMENSKATEKGIGWHRIGIDGAFPTTGLLRGRNSRGGGQTWSGPGKICPGDKRINQVPALVKRVADYRGTSSAPDPNKSTAPVAPTGTGYYTVKTGDTLWSIANAHSMSVGDLKSMNGLKSNEILTGQTLKVIGGGVYKVVNGDTLWSIARRFGVTVANLQAWNALKNTVLKTGQALKVKKPVAPSTHTVVKGDSLWSIANKYGTTVNALRKLNGLKSDTLYVGMSLKVK